jgi:hypothetical protein
MGRLIPNGFLTIRQAADRFAVALYSGTADRPTIEQQRKSGFDVADGAAIEDAISKIWTAVDRGKLQAFVIGPGRRSPLKLSARMSAGIPLLRSPKGGDFTFLRPSNPHYSQFVQWFGRDLAKVAVVFQDADVSKAARSLLRARRRRTASAKARSAGRPSRMIELKRIIREIIDKRRWSPTQSLKALTRAANQHARCMTLVSDETVTRALDNLHSETGDRRFERLRRFRE